MKIEIKVPFIEDQAILISVGEQFYTIAPGETEEIEVCRDGEISNLKLEVLPNVLG